MTDLTKCNQLPESDTRGEVTAQLPSLHPELRIKEGIEAWDEDENGNILCNRPSGESLGVKYAFGALFARERQLLSALSANLLLREENERLRTSLAIEQEDLQRLAKLRSHDLDLMKSEVSQLMTSNLALREENERLRAELATEEASCLEEIKNRDEWEERATNLANAVGEYLEVPVGEHSNINCPIGEAHKILNGEYKTKFTLRASASSKWIEIKEGCEMPEHDTRVLVYRKRAHRDTEPEIGLQRCYLGEQYPLGLSVTHWQPIIPPTATNTEKATSDRSQV